jgi:hypothetical protein
LIVADSKIRKRFEDHGCGFPVILENVPMIKVRGVWTPDVDYDKLHEAVLRALANCEVRLTGNQIRFIRHYFGFTLAAFGDYFDVSHSAVIKWENAGDEMPSVKWPVERDLRLFILDRLQESPKEIGKLYRRLHSSAGRPHAKKLRLTKTLSPVFFNYSNDHRTLATT